MSTASIKKKLVTAGKKLKAAQKAEKKTDKAVLAAQKLQERADKAYEKAEAKQTSAAVKRGDIEDTISDLNAQLKAASAPASQAAE